MQKLMFASLTTLICSTVACSDPSSPTTALPDCPSGNCGKEPFRRAVPTRAKVRIDNPTGTTQMRRASHTAGLGLGHSRAISLEATSPAMLEVADQVDEINEVIELVFGELEAGATHTPEIESDTEHLWRSDDADVPGHDDVLRLTTADGVHFEVAYFTVPAGAGLTGATPIVSGEVAIDDDDNVDFHLSIDLDAMTDADPEFDGEGQIVIAAMPLAGGDSEHWFDYHGVTFGNEPVETSRTTAWSFAPDSGALEFVSDIDGGEATVYARWDERGGRYDHHVEVEDADVGLIDEIATNCWDPTGAEDFDAWANIDADLQYYGELAGDESECVFGPVADHPEPGEDFENLPAEGEWDELELQSWCEVSSDC